jgi:hypothetical protein
MACRICGSTRQKEFPSEVNLHPPHGLEHLSSPCVLAFLDLFVCLDCGFTELVLQESDRSELAQNYGNETLAAGRTSDTDSARVRRIAASRLN